jgi:hypothetical protein
MVADRKLIASSLMHNTTIFALMIHDLSLIAPLS